MSHRSWRILTALAFLPSASAQEGVTLFQGFQETTTRLVDSAGANVNSWPGSATPGTMGYLDANGDLVRAILLATGPPGSGGGLQRLSWDGTLLWNWQMFSSTFIPHHDIALLPNGNVLITAFDVLSPAQAIAAGRNPATVSANFLPEIILEIQQTGPTTGAVVWEWRAMDHLVQDFDAGQANFGVVGNHPELIDVNYPPQPAGDWLHFNAIDYNPELDQIAVSASFLNEIWIIDHSTTTAEAAGHSGGNSGKGGDILYRWGNPAAYRRGTAADQMLYFSHDVQWIRPGLPGAGNILLFHNGNGRPQGTYSSADELTPPVDAQGNYSLAPGAAWGPTSLTWTYFDPANFYSMIMGGVQRLPSGNTLITQAVAGRMFEVTPAGSIVWTYVNPNVPPVTFKARRYHETVTGEDFCFGDGGIAPGCTPCPCSNDAAPGTRGGCINAASRSARLLAGGLPSVSADSLHFDVRDATPSTFAVLAVADNRLPADPLHPCFGLQTGLATGGPDGLQCIGGNLHRYATRGTDAAGAIGLTTPGWGPPNAPFAGIVVTGGFGAGQSKNFQVFYRENLSVGCGSGVNTTNGFGIVVLP